MESPVASGAVPCRLAWPLKLITTAPSTAPQRKTSTNDTMAIFSLGRGRAAVAMSDTIFVLNYQRAESLSGILLAPGGQCHEHTVAVGGFRVGCHRVVLRHDRCR